MPWHARSTPRRRPPQLQPEERSWQYVKRLVQWVRDTDPYLGPGKISVSGTLPEALQRLADAMGPRQRGVAWFCPPRGADETTAGYDKRVLDDWLAWAQGGW